MVEDANTNEEEENQTENPKVTVQKSKKTNGHKQEAKPVDQSHMLRKYE